MSEFVFLLPEGAGLSGSSFVFYLPFAGADAVGPSLIGDGNIGLQGPSIVMLRLTESDGVRPADSAGNLTDLVPTTPAPPSVATWTGRGRAFVYDSGASFAPGFTATDRPGRDTLAMRDVSVQAILALNEGGAEEGVIYKRGFDEGTVSFQVAAQATGPDVASVNVYWDGAAPLLFPVAVTAGEFFLLTVTRRWESTTRVVVRVYIGGTLVGETVSDDGVIVGSTTAPTVIGSSGEGDRYFNGVLDELRVADYEISGEEVAATYARLAVYQPAGVAMLRGLLPPGVRWLADPSTRIGRLMKIAGQALGYGMAKAEELRATWLPDRAYRDLVERWERIRGIAPRPRDSLDVRRVRLAALFQREHGYSVPKIQDALAPILGVDPGDVSIVEFQNVDNVDAFDSLAPNRYWLLPAPADWSVSSGTLRAQRPIGADLATDPSLALADLSSGAGRIAFQVKLASATAWPEGSSIGLALRVGSTGARSSFGVVKDSPDYRLGHRLPDGTAEILIGVPPLAWTPAAPLWLRVYAMETPGSYTVEVCTVPTLDAWTGSVVTGHVVNPDYAGPAVWGSDDSLAAADVRFDDFLTRTPRGTQPFYWYAPVDPGSDIEGARHLVSKMKPAHTHAAAIAIGSHVVCDVPETVCDREPLAE